MSAAERRSIFPVSLEATGRACVIATPSTSLLAAPFWDKKLGDIDEARGKISQMEWMLKAKDKNGPNKDGAMTPEEQAAYIKDYRAKVVTPEDEAIWKRGASNAGYHYLGCAKTFALMGKAFAESILDLQKK